MEDERMNFYHRYLGLDAMAAQMEKDAALYKEMQTHALRPHMERSFLLTWTGVVVMVAVIITQLVAQALDTNTRLNLDVVETGTRYLAYISAACFVGGIGWGAYTVDRVRKAMQRGG